MADLSSPGSTWTPGMTGLQTLEDLKKQQDASREIVKELGQDQFLQLLTAQLKYQDPLEPQTDTAFVAQLAQFTQLEAINDLSASMKNSSYYNLVGKLVYAEANVDGVTYPISGYVNGVVIKNGVAYAQIGDNEEFLVECSAIQQIYNDDFLNLDNPLVNHSSLIGKTVTATIYELDEDGNKIEDEDDPSGYKTKEVKGEVTRMSYEDGIVYAHVKYKVPVLDDDGEPVEGEFTEESEKIAIVSITDIESK